jgi:hypothetical protein
VAKIVLDDVGNLLGNPGTAANTINENNARIEAALDTLLSRDGTTPNQFEADLDLNHNDVLNAGIISADDILVEGVNLSERLEEIVDAKDIALAAAEDAQEFRDEAGDSASEAAASAELAKGYVSDAVSQGNVPIYSTTLTIPSLSLPEGLSAFRTNGFSTVGDGGGALYRRVVSEPSHGGKVQSQDGSWWEIVDREISVEMFSGLPEAKSLADSLTYKKTLVVDGAVTISEPIEYDNSRNDTWKGSTDISNYIDGGSTVTYTGVGKTGTISSATNDNPAVFTSVGHTFVDDDVVFVIDGTGGTWGPALNGGPWLVDNVSGDTFTLKTITGTALSGTGLGSLSAATIRTVAAMSALQLMGSFAQSYRGLTVRATSEPETIIHIGANDALDNTDFSGSVTSLYGLQIRPELTGVSRASLWVENHKFLNIQSSWINQSPNTSPGILLGGKRDNNRRTLLEGAVYNTLIGSSYFLGSDLSLENVEGLNLIATQFDGFDHSSKIYTTSGGIASGVHVDTVLFSEHGHSDSGTAAIHQGRADQSASILRPYSGGWTIENSVIRDYPVGIHLEAGMARISANQLRGRNPGNVGIVIGEYARQELIDCTNDFSQMSRAGNIGIEDRRYKTVPITGATQTNPVVLTFSGGHHFHNGERIRISGVGGMTEINNKEFLVAGATSTTIQLNSLDDAGATSSGVNGTGYTAYTSGGTAMRPYMWHRDNFGGVILSVGHSDMIFDLELDQYTTLSTGNTNVLNMFNVPVVGGHYEVTYGAVVDMSGQSGQVRFDLSVGGTVVAPSSFERQSAGSDEVHHFFQRRMFIPGISGTSGSTIRFRCNTTGTVSLRGRGSTTLGTTFCQIRRVA